MLSQLTRQEVEIAFQLIHKHPKLPKKLPPKLKKLSKEEWTVLNKVLRLLMQEKTDNPLQ